MTFTLQQLMVQVSSISFQKGIECGDKKTIIKLFLPNCSCLCLVVITAAQAVLRNTPRLRTDFRFTTGTTSLNDFKWKAILPSHVLTYIEKNASPVECREILIPLRQRHKHSILQGLLKVNTDGIFPFIRSWIPVNAVIDNRTDERKEKNTGNKASFAFERIVDAHQLREVIDEFHRDDPENSSIAAPKGGFMRKSLRKLRDKVAGTLFFRRY
uniref:Uncharacterized protein n=1 Tax=Glossina pallidipes TaxID=7398 RepID=A0A1A9ZST2_GLOPL